jgi:hypothetical protein
VRGHRQYSFVLSELALVVMQVLTKGISDGQVQQLRGVKDSLLGDASVVDHPTPHDAPDDDSDAAATHRIFLG